MTRPPGAAAPTPAVGGGGWLVVAPILALTLGHIFSNAIRTLSTFAGEKIISMDGRKIKITDLSKLESMT